MPRNRAVPVLLLLSVSVLAGCADDSTKNASSSASPSASATTSAGSSGTASPTKQGSSHGSASSSSSSSASSPSSSSEPSASSARTDAPTLPTQRIEAANLHVAVLGENAASTPEEKAVVNAWMAYWQGAADTYYYYRPAQGLLDSSQGKAQSSVLGYLAKTKREKKRVVGWARDNVTSVKVSGSSATVRDCTKNFTFSVDQESEPLTKPTPYYDVTGRLDKVDGHWVVTSQKTQELNDSCLS